MTIFTNSSDSHVILIGWVNSTISQEKRAEGTGTFAQFVVITTLEHCVENVKKMYDILLLTEKMKKMKAAWVPGTDHIIFCTNDFVVEADEHVLVVTTDTLGITEPYPIPKTYQNILATQECLYVQVIQPRLSNHRGAMRIYEVRASSPSAEGRARLREGLAGLVDVTELELPDVPLVSPKMRGRGGFTGIINAFYTSISDDGVYAVGAAYDEDYPTDNKQYVIFAVNLEKGTSCIERCYAHLADVRFWPGTHYLYLRKTGNVFDYGVEYGWEYIYGQVNRQVNFYDSKSFLTLGGERGTEITVVPDPTGRLVFVDGGAGGSIERVLGIEDGVVHTSGPIIKLKSTSLRAAWNTDTPTLCVARWHRVFDKILVLPLDRVALGAPATETRARLFSPPESLSLEARDTILPSRDGTYLLQKHVIYSSATKVEEQLLQEQLLVQNALRILSEDAATTTTTTQEEQQAGIEDEEENIVFLGSQSVPLPLLMMSGVVREDTMLRRRLEAVDNGREVYTFDEGL